MKNLKHLLLLILLISACSEDDTRITPVHQPAPLTGKIPRQILNFGAVFSSDVVDYSYLECGLKGYGSFRYEYDESNRVGRINLGANRYEEYTYDGDQVISSAQYRKDNEEEGFLQRVGYSFIYENGFLAEVENTFTGETTKIVYDAIKANVDTTRTYDVNGALVSLNVFEYDEMNNSHANLPTITFGSRLQGRRNKNNITRRHTTNYGERPGQFQTSYSYEYEEEYPVVIYPLGASFLADSIHISYTDCP